MTAWETAISFTLLREGGLVDHQSDAGRLTRWGISKRAHPDVDIATLTRDQAIEIYRWHYWLKPGCHRLPGAVAIAFFDFVVHSPEDDVSRILQRLVGADPDGQVGPKTARACELAAERLGGDGALAVRLIEKRVDYLTRLIRRKPDQLDFLGGWWDRTVGLTALVSTYGG